MWTFGSGDCSIAGGEIRFFPCRSPLQTYKLEHDCWVQGVRGQRSPRATAVRLSLRVSATARLVETQRYVVFTRRTSRERTTPTAFRRKAEANRHLHLSTQLKYVLSAFCAR